MATETRIRIAIAAVSVLVLAALAGAVVTVAALDTTTERHSRTLQGPVSRIVLDSDAGDVRLRTSSDSAVTVRETRHFSTREPKLQADLRDGVLTIAVDCSGFLSVTCSDDLDITVPRTVRQATLELSSGDAEVAGLAGERFTVESDSGDIAAQDMRGAITLSTDSGDVEAEGIVGPLVLDSDSGDVGGERVEADSVTATTDSGSVALTLDTAPTAVEVETDSGDVELALPRGSYRVETEADSGDVAVDGLLPDAGAARSVAARSDSGDVQVRGVG